MEKLTICFDPWMIYNKNTDYEGLMLENLERGFNCIRADYGAGFLWNRDGSPIGKVPIRHPFGKFTAQTTFHELDHADVDLLERVLKLCRAAQKYGVKIIFSNWFFCHTTWFCTDSSLKQPVFDMSTEEKMTFFGGELDRFLTFLKKENVIDVVAFAELFNEFDGLPFAGAFSGVSEEEAVYLRGLHENVLADLKKKHPDILFAFDSFRADIQESLIPRNIDVLNFHCYYSWPIYQAFEKGLTARSTEKMVIPPETAYYLVENINTPEDVLREMDPNLSITLDWPRRLSLYTSIDPQKEGELSAMLHQHLVENMDVYLGRLYDKIDTVVELHARLCPDAYLVMGEGGTFCGSPIITFERDSDAYWELLRKQTEYIRNKGIHGTILKTTLRPVEISWDCVDKYKALNTMFLEK